MFPRPLQQGSSQGLGKCSGVLPYCKQLYTGCGRSRDHLDLQSETSLHRDATQVHGSLLVYSRKDWASYFTCLLGCHHLCVLGTLVSPPRCLCFCFFVFLPSSFLCTSLSTTFLPPFLCTPLSAYLPPSLFPSLLFDYTCGQLQDNLWEDLFSFHRVSSQD